MFLEELAAQFQLKTQDAIDRLHKLVEEDVLTGIAYSFRTFEFFVNILFSAQQE